MKIVNRKIYLALISIMLILSSCREDIIPPNTPSSNLNEPVRLISGSSYTFILNANNISTTYRDYSGLSGTHSMINISLTAYKSGTVIFHIYSNSDQVLFQKAMSDNINEFSEYLDKENPSIVHIILNNFTGNLKIIVDNW